MLINNERLEVNITSSKACTVVSTDTCYQIDKAHCSINSYDVCTKDFAACYDKGYDFCTPTVDDTDACIDSYDYN